MASYASARGVIGNQELEVWSCEGEAVIKIRVDGHQKSVEVERGSIARLQQLFIDGRVIPLNATLRRQLCQLAARARGTLPR